MDVRPGVTRPDPSRNAGEAPEHGPAGRPTSRAVAVGVVAVGVVLAVALVGVFVWPGGHGSSSDDDAGTDASDARPFFGLDLPSVDEDRVARIAKAVGCAPAVQNVFVKLDSTSFDEGLLQRLGANGREPMITLEPWSWQSTPEETDLPAYSLTTIVDGQHDDAFRRIARVLATHPGPVMVRFAHEMNANWYPWAVGVNGNTASDYVAAWRHVHDLMSGIDPRIQWVWAPATVPWDDQPLPLKDVYPGDDQVDYVGVSGYGHADQDGTRTATQTYGPWYDEIRTFTKKPAILSEMGADGDAKDSWIASLPSFLHDRPGIVGFVWYDTSPETTGATGDYRIDDTPAHLAAFRSALHDIGVHCR